MGNMIPKKTTTTTKKIKFIGEEQFINSETGELVNMQVTNVEERDFNFNKVFMRNFLFTLDNLGNKKIKVATYIMDNADSNNVFFGTINSIMSATGFCRQTVIDTIKILIDSDFMKRTQIGVYLINANQIAKGTHQHRLDMLNRYTNIDKPQKELTDEQKIKNIEKTINTLEKKLEKIKNNGSKK